MKSAIIQKITLAHCARGVRTCFKCREMYTRKYCLLDITPGGFAARPVIEVESDGEKVWREYDIAKIFETYDTAFAYSEAHKIDFVEEKPGEADAALEKLKTQLPAHWSMFIEHDRLTVKRSEPAYEQITNLLNAPAVLVKGQQQGKGGKEVYCTFVFQLETRWYPERLLWARKTNREIDREIGRLAEKYDLSGLFARAEKNTKGILCGKNDAETQRIAAYENEKKELQGKRVPLPDYVSGNYCLFLKEKKGMQDEYTLIFPEEASQEMHAVEKKFREIFEVWR